MLKDEQKVNSLNGNSCGAKVLAVVKGSTYYRYIQIFVVQIICLQIIADKLAEKSLYILQSIWITQMADISTHV